MTEINCAIFHGTKSEARLWEIDENFRRAELTPDQYREHVNERVKVIAQIEAEKMAHGKVPSGGVQPRDRAIAKTAKHLGISRSKVSRIVQAESLTPEAKAAAKAAGLGLMKQVEMARLPAEKQVEAVQQIAKRHAAEMNGIGGHGNVNKRKCQEPVPRIGDTEQSMDTWEEDEGTDATHSPSKNTAGYILIQMNRLPARDITIIVEHGRKLLSPRMGAV